MKAIVLCAGLGSRLRPLTFSTAKHLIPVANKPVLFYCIEALAAVGVQDIGVVVNQDSREAIREAAGDGRRWNVRMTYIDQASPKGLAHAVQCSQAFVGTEPFIVYLGDTLIPEGLAGTLDRFHCHLPSAVVAVKAVDDPRRYGIATTAGGRIVQMVEKPKQPTSSLAVAGVYVFDQRIFESIRHIRPSWRNEYEIADALQHLIDRGLTVLPHILTGWWQDTGQPHDLLAANRALLQTITGGIHGSVDAASVIEGRVRIDANAEIIRSHIHGPAIIGADARIRDAHIGPFTSIGDRVQLVGCRIEDSIVMDDCVIQQLPQPLIGSVLGRRVQVTGESPATDGVRLLLGDDCEARLT